jgi:glucosamine--fructose-6-phosphate aminotransferase (isomerizing)
MSEENALGNPRVPHTLTEILSQPRVWESTLRKLSELRETDLPRLAEYDQVLFTGCGSTYYLSVWASRHFQQAHGVICTAVPASEVVLFPDAWVRKGAKALLVAISRSAQTTETLKAVRVFQERGYGKTISITCNPEGRLAQMTEGVLATPDGQEEGVAQTRSFSSMMLAVALLSERRVPAELPQSLRASGERIIDRYGSLAAEIGSQPDLTRFFFLGSGPLFGLASEAMLKMKEMSLSYAEAFHFMEFRHGPMSMVDSHTLVVGLLSDQGRGQELGVLDSIRRFGARTLVISEASDESVPGAVDYWVSIASEVPAAWRAPLYLPVLQLLACHRAVANGQDPDHPAHLQAVVELEPSGSSIDGRHDSWFVEGRDKTPDMRRGIDPSKPMLFKMPMSGRSEP